MTGTDPTRIPLEALVAPIAGLVATGFVALHVTTSHRQPAGIRRSPVEGCTLPS